MLILRHYRASPLRQPRVYFQFLLFDRERTNFTYGLANADELAGFVAETVDASREDVERYLREVGGDVDLEERLATRLRPRRDRNDQPKFGRRLGWYCFVRATKPRLVVETGTADGLGSALLARALQRNRAEGDPGELLTFDVDPSSGWLLDGDLLDETHVVIGDTTATLPQTLEGRQVDVFIHDSLHTYEHERFELETAVAHAGERLLLISDNAHATTALADLCRELAIPYAFFRERPLRHFYPGAGIGLGIYDRTAVRTAETTASASSSVSSG